jgi:alginate O-acetyltransferase complex protein AlgJ
MVDLNHLHILRPEVAENRVLATMPETPHTWQELRAWPRKLDAYVADNFPARPYFIGWINYARYRLGYSGTPQIVVGRSGWLFYDNGSHLDQARDSHPLKATERMNWVSTFAARIEALRPKNITYLVMSAPVKELIYPDKAPPWARKGKGDAEVLDTDARRVGYPNLIALRKALIQRRDLEPKVYPPFDTHWAGLGAYEAYLELVARLRALGYAIKPLPLSAFSRSEVRGSDLATMLGISSFVGEPFPRFENVPVEAGLKTTYLTDKTDWTATRIIDTGLEGKPSIQLTMDSFSSELFHFLYPHFSRIIVSHAQDGFYREDLISTYQPNIVLLEVIESGLRHVMSPPLRPSPAVQDSIERAFWRPADGASATRK